MADCKHESFCRAQLEDAETDSTSSRPGHLQPALETPSRDERPMGVVRRALGKRGRPWPITDNPHAHRASTRRSGNGAETGREWPLALAAALAAALATSLLGAGPAHAQTTTLVSNTGESISSTSTDAFQAQHFTTGTHTAGYTLTSVEIRLFTVASRSTSVKIRTNNNGVPGNLVATLTNPANLTGDSLNVFTAPGNTHLEAETIYWVSVGEGISADRALLSRTDSVNQTGETGWSIGDGRIRRFSETSVWSSVQSDNLVFAIRGAERTGDTTPPRVAIDREDPNRSNTNADSLTWALFFSEDVKNVDAADFAVTGTTATVTDVTEVTPSRVFFVTVSGGDLASLNGRVTLSFAPGQDIKDNANNALTDTVLNREFNSFDVKNTAPTLTITGLPASSSAAFRTARFSFSEFARGFGLNDIAVRNGTASSFGTVRLGRVFTARIAPTADGTVTVDVPAGAAEDSFGNLNEAARASWVRFFSGGKFSPALH